MDHFVAEGREAYYLGRHKGECPYGYTMMMQRCAWLAGWNDAERAA